MAQPYPHLLSPLQCGKFIFKNRMQSSNSLPHFSQGPEKYPADPTIAHFLGRAKSGAAFVTLAGFEDSVNAPQFPTLWTCPISLSSICATPCAKTTWWS